MPTPHCTYNISDQPVFASPLWRAFKPFIRMDNAVSDEGDTCGIWMGSGFQIKDLPCYKKSLFHYSHDEADICGNCKGSNMVCIYLHNVMDQSGADIDTEIYCNDYRRYTQYNGYN